MKAEESLELLREGNRRFASGVRSVETLVSTVQLAELAISQSPFAIVLACSDSRVPVELVFDRGPGDLFVIRVAGNIVAPSIVGSVEFAAAKFGTRLAIVLGHTNCGAVAATIDSVRGAQIGSDNIGDIVERIRPTVETVMESAPDLDEKSLAERCCRANVRSSADRLRHGSVVLERLASEGLMIVEALYELETGKVHFFDRTPLERRSLEEREGARAD